MFKETMNRVLFPTIFYYYFLSNLIDQVDFLHEEEARAG